MGKSIDDRSANAKAGKRARTAHKSDFFDVLPSFVIFCKFFVQKGKKFFGESVTGIPFVDIIVEF